MERLSVTDIIIHIKGLLEGEFKQVSIVGEISNLTCSGAGHWYFTLSDEESSISAAMFKMDALRNPLIRKINDGDKVICLGRIGVYQKRGTFQVIVQRIANIGKGDLKAQFDALKRKLASEGLFDIENKRPIPQLPKRIALITSKTGAALHDFINVYKRRSHWMNLLVVPSIVQGDEAPQSLIRAIKKTVEYSSLQKKENLIDLIILTRGGGSFEDLWAFNDEGLAREIFACPIPIVSAVGHQVDFTISDYVADFRCETPSAAAEIVTMDQVNLFLKMEKNAKDLLNISSIIVKKAMESLSLFDPRIVLDIIWNKYNHYQKRLQSQDLRGKLQQFINIHDFQMRTDEAISSIERLVALKHSDLFSKMEKHKELLRVLDPNNVLERGYSYITDRSQNVIGDFKSFSNVSKGSELNIKFYDGEGKVKKV